jgi:NitT/TauT family transport system substrate-binding protein
MRTRTVIATLAVSGLALLTAACSSSGGGGNPAQGGSGAGGGDHVNLMLNWYPYGEHAALYYGVKEGIYKKYGIDLSIAAGQGSGKTVQAVGSGHAQFGWADTASVLAGVQSGLPVKSVGVFLQTTPASVQFLSSEKISTPADLKGKTIAATAGDALSSTFPAFLKRNGLSSSEVKLQNVDASGKIAAVSVGRVDALLGNMNDQGPTIENQTGKQVSYLPFAKFGLNYLSDGLIASDSTISKNSDLVRRMVQATSDAYAQAAQHQSQAVSDMQGASEQLPPSSVLKKSFAETVPLLHTAATKTMPPGQDVAAEWTQTISVMANAGLLKHPDAPGKYWAPQFAPKG